MKVPTWTQLIDGAGSYLRHLYMSVRQGMLLLSGASLVLWGITGFNPPEGAVPLIAIQWSTFFTFCFFFYVIMVNLQIGGIESLTRLIAEMKYDVDFMRANWRHPMQSRHSYHSEAVVDPLRAAIMSTLLCVGALFFFEDLWVPLYDYFQFGNVLWPVYFAQRTATSSLLTTQVFDRNLFYFVIPFAMALLVLPSTIDFDQGNYWHRFSMKFRFTRTYVGILLACAISWILWINFPHQPTDLSHLTPANILGPLASTFKQSNCYIYPSQGLFPQNTYTFYPCSIYLKPYLNLDLIMGFFNPDPWVHLINVVTKFITFLALLYPALVRVACPKK